MIKCFEWHLQRNSIACGISGKPSTKMRKSRACFCSSGLAIVLGIILAAAGVGILVAISFDQPDRDLWLVLVMMIGGGLAVIFMGLFCCGCSVMCFSSDNSVGVMNLEDEEELTKQTISNTEEDWNNLCLRDFSYNNRVHLNILYGLFNEADIFNATILKRSVITRTNFVYVQLAQLPISF